MVSVLLVFVVVIVGTPTLADVVNGVLITGPGARLPRAGEAVVTLPPPGAVSISFDDFAAPCAFVNSSGPLTSRYAAQGVTFAGIQSNGGAVLDQCGNFGVTGHSSPNFLAFNVVAVNTLPGGGTPVGPETITFAEPVSAVQINVGHESSGIITLQCSGDAGPISASTVVGTSTLVTLSVQGGPISACTLSFTGSALVVDDLAFVVYVPPIPTIAGLGLLALVFAMIGIGMTRIHDC